MQLENSEIPFGQFHSPQALELSSLQKVVSVSGHSSRDSTKREKSWELFFGERGSSRSGKIKMNYFIEKKSSFLIV